MKSLKMQFQTEFGSKTSIDVPGVRADVKAAEVKKLMDDIIAKNIISTKTGDITAKQGAKIVDVSETELF